MKNNRFIKFILSGYFWEATAPIWGAPLLILAVILVPIWVPIFCILGIVDELSEAWENFNREG